MIPGDIDLTENLDFRKRVKKELPQLPSVWNKNEVKINNKYNFNVTYTSSSNSTTTYNISTNTHIDDITWFGYYNDFDTISNYVSSVSIYNNSSTTPAYITWNDTDDSTYTTSDRLLANIRKEEIEKDIFGNIKRKPECIPKIPWGSSYLHFLEFKPIAWQSRYSGIKTYISLDSDNKIPWKDEHYHDAIISSSWKKENEYDRVKKLISWLSDKSFTFIKRYLDHDNEEDLSYLTNMSWIRVKDAIIE